MEVRELSEERDRAEKIALRVMNWTKKDSETWDSVWRNEDGETECECIDWHPSQDDTQALMVAERLRQLGWSVTWRTVPDSWVKGKRPKHNITLHYIGTTHDEFRQAKPPFWIEGDAETLAAAIEQAAYRVATALEEANQ